MAPQPWHLQIVGSETLRILYTFVRAALELPETAKPDLIFVNLPDKGMLCMLTSSCLQACWDLLCSFKDRNMTFRPREAQKQALYARFPQQPQLAS